MQTRGEIPADIFARWLRQDLDCYTYFAQGKWTGRIKIGKSKDPWQRVRQISTSENGEEARLLLTLRGEHLEMLYHREFADHCVGGEWFSPAPEILAEIDRLKSESAA